MTKFLKVVLMALVIISPTFAQMADEVVFSYATYDNQPVEIVYEHSRNRLTIRVAVADDSFKNHNATLAFLKQEILGLTSQTTKRTAVGNTGFTLVYMGGHPTWGPHTTTGTGKTYNCLLFSEKARIGDRGQILFEGTSEPQAFNGYQQWKPN